MKLLQYLHIENSIAANLATIALAITIGMVIGGIRFRGMRLGLSGVLLAAVAFGQMGLAIEGPILHFLRDFALIIFIYALGLQVGPGFVSSLRAEGLRLNMLSVAVLALGALMTFAVVRLAKLPVAASPGIYAGAFTTTPGLAAGQEALRQRARMTPNHDSGLEFQYMDQAALAYSVTFPFGVIGPILVIVLLNRLFRIKIDSERAKLLEAEETRRPPVDMVDFEVTDPTYSGTLLRDHPLVRKHGVVFTRLLRGQSLSVPTGDTEVRLHDVFRAVGARTNLSELVAAMGRATTADLGRAIGDVSRMDLVVTRTAVLRQTLADMDFIRRYGVTVARITRAGVDLVPHSTLRLQFADNLTVVGSEAGLKSVEAELGNSPEQLNRPQLIPIFLGIVMGVVVGSIPFTVPGLHTTLRIGLAGGPLLAAIVLSQLGNLGSVVWYMPPAANALFRDFGLAVFLACVGLDAGNDLWHRMVSGGGATYVLWGAMLTIVPVSIVACVARLMFKMNFITLAGWVSGAMTSSTALDFSNDLAQSDSPAVAYAAVAPLATLLPIICAQLLAL